MKSEKLAPSPFSTPFSRREFLAASMASIAIAAFDQYAFADTNPEEIRNLSEASFQHASQRAAELVSRMTLDEVTHQLVHNTPALPKLSLARYNYWSEALHGVNVDGPITSFPQPIALGCSWNPDLVHQVYTAVSDEARAYHNKTGYGLTYFSPATVNMGLRDPRWGRCEENFSEDPLLVQTLAVQTVRAMQGDDPKYLKTVACAKHYICNETDTDRDYADAAPDRRSFWEYYTRGFEACVTEARVFTVMASYNSLWGVPCVADPMLLTNILRKRWGFKGYVVSDCDAVADIYKTHHYVQTGPEAAALAIKAGSDLNCGNTYSEHLAKACQDKLVSEEAVRTALMRVLTGRFLLGEFDPPADVPWSGLSPELIEGQRHRDLAREAARQSLVLLKNEKQSLPLSKSSLKKVAIIGPMAGSCHLGGYSGRSTHLVSPYLGVSAALGSVPYGDIVPAGEYVSTSNFRGPTVNFADDGTQSLTMIKNNDWAQYGPLDFSERTSIELIFASSVDGDIELYFDMLGKTPALTLHAPATGGMATWKTVSVPLAGPTGSHVVFLKFKSKTRDHFFNLQSLQFLPSKPTTPSATQVVYAPGCTIIGPRNQTLLDNAAKAAREAEVALVFVGDNRLLSDEGRDREYLHLPEVQHELIKAVVAANPRTILVVNSCCPVALNWEKENVPAILCSLNAGEEQGNAIADALFGDHNPGGKLCSTWFRDVAQLPNFHDYDIKHGRTYMYFHGDPLYAFGHGLSYTTFGYENIRIKGDRLQPDKAITLSAEISNTGHVAGVEIVQFYVQASGEHQRPIKQLAGFQRVSLRPGEKQTVSFSLAHDHIALRYWDDDKGQFVYDPGVVQLMIGSSSADIRLHNHIDLV
jgi:beta-glucosidase